MLFWFWPLSYPWWPHHWGSFLPVQRGEYLHLHSSGSFLWFWRSINQIKYGRMLSRPAFTVIFTNPLRSFFEVGLGSSNVYQTQYLFPQGTLEIQRVLWVLWDPLYRGLWFWTLGSSSSLRWQIYLWKSWLKIHINNDNSTYSILTFQIVGHT